MSNNQIKNIEEVNMKRKVKAYVNFSGTDIILKIVLIVENNWIEDWDYDETFESEIVNWMQSELESNPQTEYTQDIYLSLECDEEFRNYEELEEHLTAHIIKWNLRYLIVTDKKRKAFFEVHPNKNFATFVITKKGE